MAERDPNELVGGKCACNVPFRRGDFSRYCGAYVCHGCGDHKGMARCFCGWSLSGGDGRRELELDGEQIEADY